MADFDGIKDMLVTAESLKELHDYNEESYVKRSYVDELFNSANSSGIPKLQSYHLPLLVAETDGQTNFVISSDAFNATTDTILVWSGRTYIHQNSDYTINNNTIILNEGVPAGTTIAIVILRVVLL